MLPTFFFVCVSLGLLSATAEPEHTSLWRARVYKRVYGVLSIQAGACQQTNTSADAVSCECQASNSWKKSGPAKVQRCHLRRGSKARLCWDPKSVFGRVT